jgi:hypothetical protein
MQGHVVEHEYGLVGGQGVVGVAGDIECDQPQSPGRVVLVDLEAHPADLGG